MTEITANTIKPAPPPVPVMRYIVDPVAFFVALFGAPILVAILFFWVLGIPVIAIVFGGPIYLLLGFPTLMIWLSRRQVNIREIAGLAFAVFAAALSLCTLAGLALKVHDLDGYVAFFGGFGIIFAPLWGGVFAKLYRDLRRDFYALPYPASLT